MSYVTKREMVDCLLTNMSKVKNVEDWLCLSGLDQLTFDKLSYHYFGQNAAYVLNYLRMLVVVDDFHNNPQNSLSRTAVNTGLMNEKKLSKFVQEQLGISPAHLKEKVFKEDTYIKIVRLIMNYAGLEIDVEEILSHIMHQPTYS